MVVDKNLPKDAYVTASDEQLRRMGFDAKAIESIRKAAPPETAAVDTAPVDESKAKGKS